MQSVSMMIQRLFHSRKATTGQVSPAEGPPLQWVQFAETQTREHFYPPNTLRIQTRKRSRAATLQDSYLCLDSLLSPIANFLFHKTDLHSAAITHVLGDTPAFDTIRSPAFPNQRTSVSSFTSFPSTPSQHYWHTVGFFQSGVVVFATSTHHVDVRSCLFFHPRSQKYWDQPPQKDS